MFRLARTDGGQPGGAGREENAAGVVTDMPAGAHGLRGHDVKVSARGERGRCGRGSAR